MACTPQQGFLQDGKTLFIDLVGSPPWKNLSNSFQAAVNVILRVVDFGVHDVPHFREVFILRVQSGDHASVDGVERRSLFMGLLKGERHLPAIEFDSAFSTRTYSATVITHYLLEGSP